MTHAAAWSWGEAGTPAGHLTVRTRQLTSPALVRRGLHHFMHYSPKHAALRTPLPVHLRLAACVGVALAGSATVAGGIATPSSPAQASSVWDRVAACESGGNWHISTGNGFYGGLQFTNQTWAGFGGPRVRLTRGPRHAGVPQIAVAQKVLASQGPGAWPRLQRQGRSGHAATAARSPSVSRSTTRSPIKAHGTNAAYHGGRLAVDGVMGPNTTRALQRWIGTSADGVFGPRRLAPCSTRSACTLTARSACQHASAPCQTRIGTSHDGALATSTPTPCARCSPTPSTATDLSDVPSPPDPAGRAEDRQPPLARTDTPSGPAVLSG